MTNTDIAIQAVADTDAVIIDVRRDDEWAAGHADRAIHCELDKIAAGEIPDIPKDKKIYTYCAAGVRAGKAAALLQEYGWSKAESLGGLTDWQDAGGAVTL